MKIFLHAGSGQKTYREIPISFQPPVWQEIRLDIDPSVKPDIVGDIVDMKQIPDQKFDAIFTSHTVEHLYTHEVYKSFKEFLRILKPEGFIVIVCPDLKIISKMISEGKIVESIYESPEGPITPLDMLYGHRNSIARGEKYMAHHTGFTLPVLLASLKDVGFGSAQGVEWQKGFELWAIATKNKVSDTELQKLANEHLPRIF